MSSRSDATPATSSDATPASTAAPSAGLEALAPAQLARTCGGVRMQLTQYGYPNDPYADSETEKGHGAYHSLARGRSVAVTDSGLALLGLTQSQVRHSSQWVDIHTRGGGVLHRRIDDRAPERNARTDLYQPGGFDRSLPDHADVTRSR